MKTFLNRIWDTLFWVSLFLCFFFLSLVLTTLSTQAQGSDYKKFEQEARNIWTFTDDTVSAPYGIQEITEIEENHSIRFSDHIVYFYKMKTNTIYTLKVVDKVYITRGYNKRIERSIWLQRYSDPEIILVPDYIKFFERLIEIYTNLPKCSIIKS